MSAPRKYIAIDLETSGLPAEDKKGNRDFTRVCILRIGAVFCQKPENSLSRVDGMAIDLLVRPVDGIELSDKALAVNGLTREELFDHGVPIRNALEELSSWIGDDATCCCGQNLIAFDLPLLRLWMEACIDQQPHNPPAIADLEGLLSGSIIDTKALWCAFCFGLKQQAHETRNEFMYRASLQRCEFKSSLDHLAKIFLGRDAVRTGAHSPVEDCILSARVFEAMRARGILEEVLRYE